MQQVLGLQTCQSRFRNEDTLSHGTYLEATEVTPWVNGILEGVGVLEVMRNCNFSPCGALVLICSFQLQGGRSSGLIRPLDESESQREEQGP